MPVFASWGCRDSAVSRTDAGRFAGAGTPHPPGFSRLGRDAMSHDTLATLQAAAADLPRPEARLGVKPKISSIEDAELALREIAWCQAVSEAVAAAAEELLRSLNELAKQAASFEFAGESVPVADRRAVLEKELLRWGDANRETLCQGKKKSVDLRNGRIRWRDGKDAVDYCDDCSQKTAVEAIGNQSGLLARIEAIVDEIAWFGVFQAKLTVNKTNAVKARQKGQLTDEQLAEVGLQFLPGAEYVSVEPSEFVRAGV